MSPTLYKIFWSASTLCRCHKAHHARVTPRRLRLCPGTQAGGYGGDLFDVTYFETEADIDKGI
jgi:hypothetical protein